MVKKSIYHTYIILLICKMIKAKSLQKLKKVMNWSTISTMAGENTSQTSEWLLNTLIFHFIMTFSILIFDLLNDTISIIDSGIICMFFTYTQKKSSKYLPCYNPIKFWFISFFLSASQTVLPILMCSICISMFDILYPNVSWTPA